MKLNYDQTINDFEGTPFKLDDKSPSHLTIKELIMVACRSIAPGDDQLSPMDKFGIGEIGHLVSKGLDLTTEQVAKVKDRVAKMPFSPAVVYDFFNKVESAGEAKPAKGKKE